MRLLIPLLLLGCGLFKERKGVDRMPHEVHRGQGWALEVPEGAGVAVERDQVRVDSADGNFWFDVRWVDTPVVQRLAADAWAETMCETIRWDFPAEPADGVWTVGGLCSIRANRHWAMVSLEKRGDRTLLVGAVTPFGALGWEDLWVEFVTGPLSLTTGDNPADTLHKKVIRERVRKVDLPVGGATLPVPGGGVFSRSVSTAFADVWKARAAQPIPEHFADQ